MAGDNERGLTHTVNSTEGYSHRTKNSKSMGPNTNNSDLFLELVRLQSDGGLPGKTRKKRAHETVILALLAYIADLGSSAPKYSLHIERMLEFLNHYLDLNVGKDPNMNKAVELIESGQAQVNDECKEHLLNPASYDPEIVWVHVGHSL